MGRADPRSMMMPPHPMSALIVTQAQLLLRFPIVQLAAPAALRAVAPGGTSQKAGH
jgi:hypothetical protein